MTDKLNLQYKIVIAEGAYKMTLILTTRHYD